MWRPDHPAVVTVDDDGLVQAAGVGAAVVTGETDGVRYELAFTVSHAEPPILVHPGEDLQALVDARLTGTMFCLTAGVYRRQSILPRDGDAFAGDSGAVLDGEKVTEYAFRSDSGDPHPRNVLIRGLEIRIYVPDPQEGAVRADAGTGGWPIEDCDIHDIPAHTRGGERTCVVPSRVHHNECVALCSAAATQESSAGVTLETAPEIGGS